MAIAVLSPGMILGIIVVAIFCAMMIYANLVIKPRLRAQQAAQQVQKDRR